MSSQSACKFLDNERSKKMYEVWKRMNIELKTFCLTISESAIIQNFLDVLHLAELCPETITKFCINKSSEDFLGTTIQDSLSFDFVSSNNQLNLLKILRICRIDEYFTFLSSCKELMCTFNKSSNILAVLDMSQFPLSDIIYLLDQELDDQLSADIDEGNTRNFFLDSEYWDVYLKNIKQNEPIKLSAFNSLKLHYTALLKIFRNNIFFNLTKLFKMLNTYNLNWSDRSIVLLNNLAFRAYLTHQTVSNKEHMCFTDTEFEELAGLGFKVRKDKGIYSKEPKGSLIIINLRF